MDPIGFTGTLIAIIQVSFKIVSVCYEYRSNFKDAPRDISRIADEVANVGDVTRRLLKIAEGDSDSSLPSLKSMSKSGGILQQCLAELLDLKTTLKLGKMASLKTALVWPLKQKEVEKWLQAIGRIKSTLQLAISADNT